VPRGVLDAKESGVMVAKDSAAGGGVAGESDAKSAKSGDVCKILTVNGIR
jgi:L-arabinose isomerase